MLEVLERDAFLMTWYGRRRVGHVDLERPDIYPTIWDRPDQLSRVIHHLPYAQRFFATAATDGDAVTCWLD